MEKEWWTAQREQAALLVAQDEKTHNAIAAVVGIDQTTLSDWKRRVDFRERVSETVEQLRDAALKVGIADKRRRLQRLNRTWEKLKAIEVARAEDAIENPLFDGVPGADTGLIIHKKQGVGAGVAAEVIDVYEIDTSLLAELRAVEAQTAKELGQWVEKSELTGKDGAPIVISTVQQAAPLLSEWKKKYQEENPDDAPPF